MKALTWLSSSSAEIARARDVLSALKPGGVIDELGFLILQGAFADRFYPAVTTPMTRARYFIFVPAIYEYLERSRVALGKDVDRLARDLQFDLLQRLKPELGAIGKESGRGIQRPPSEIYWSGLAALGLATQRTSLATYERRLSEGAYSTKTMRDDDHAVHPDEIPSMWNMGPPLSYILPRGTFPDETTFRLRKREAELLRGRYAALRPSGRDTLITHMVSLVGDQGLASLDGVESPWQIPALPKDTKRVVDHARCLSLFARGTTLQYYRLLLDKKGEKGAGPDEAFVRWWDEAHVDLGTWDLEEFFAIVRDWDEDRRPVQDRTFLKTWIARCVEAKSGEVALRDTEARKIIADREDRVRPGKQRLRVKFQLESWQPPSNFRVGDLHQLQYRHPIGLQFAQDIVDGLQGKA